MSVGIKKNAVYALQLPRYSEYFEISISNIFAQIYKETLPYCEKRWDIELGYAGSLMIHAVQFCGLEPKFYQILT
jgi:hypothetical protein